MMASRIDYLQNQICTNYYHSLINNKCNTSITIRYYIPSQYKWIAFSVLC